MNILTQVAEQHALEALLRRFEWTLLKACGYSFSLTEEAETQTPISTEAHYQLVVGEGFVPCANGIPGEHILALAADNLTETACLKSAKLIMRQAIDHLVGGREIKTRCLWGKK
ncbi:MAG: DNA repair protein RecO, partial [Legionellales bacterium]